MQENPVCYWELAAADAERSVDFFNKVFGWDFEYDERTTIHELPAKDAQKSFAGGGIFTLQTAKLPFLTIYIKVDDIDEKARAVEKNGGSIVIGPRVVTPGGPKICLFNEPGGVTFAMVQSTQRQ